MSKVLIIDDADPAIAYSGDWSVGTTVTSITNEYKSTVHGSSRTAGDELSYAFYGTGISLYGTLDTPSTNGLPAVTFTIDNRTPIAINATGSLTDFRFNIPVSHVPLFQSPILPKGQHTLFVKTSTPTNPAARLYVDFLTVSTGSNSASGDIIVDDRDISVAFTGNWLTIGAPNEYNGTTRQSPGTSSDGTATLRFNGTAITIFGTTPASVASNSTAQIGFSIDGARSGMFTGPPNAPAIFHTPFFRVDGLSNEKEHTVVIESLSPNTFFLDYVVYSTVNSSVAGGGGGSDVEQASGIGGGVGGTRLSLGPIIGGTIVGFVGLLAIFGIICILLSRRRAARKENELDDEKEPVMLEVGQYPIIVPFTNPSPTANQIAYGLQLPDTNYVSQGNGGVMTAAKYNHVNASTSASVTQLLNESVYAGIATSNYSTVPGSQYTGHPIYSRPEAGRIPALYHPPPLAGGSNHHDRTPLKPNKEKTQFIRAGNGPNNVPAVPVPYPPLMASPLVEEDSGIRIPMTSPPLYTPL